MTVSRRALFGRLNLTLFRALESATAFAKLRGNAYVELTHWLHQIWQLQDSDLHRILRHYRIDSQVMDKDLALALSVLPSGSTSLSDFSHHISLAVERAWIISSLEFRDHRIRSVWLLVALLETPELRSLLLGISAVFQEIPRGVLDESFLTIVAGSSEDKQDAHDGSSLAAVISEADCGVMADGRDDKSGLNKYCSDLTARARAGGIDPVIGRGYEIRTMVDILLRRRQNNPLLTGEAGVGKTAIVEGLALAIARGEVPPILRDVRLLSLDLGALLAGASARGEFESRLKTLLDEADRSPRPVILFVDEVHSLIGAGGQAGTGDAANLLKPALARGTLRTVGATTWSEYKRHIEKDPALTRRFQVLQVIEPEEDSAIEMVRAMVPTFAKHHGVVMLDEAVRAAVILSHRYIPSRQLPDKAISLLDTACARVATALHAPPAAVEHLGQQMIALQTELELLSQEDVIAEGREERIVRKVAIEARKSCVSAELMAQEARWHQELALVERIHALRKAYASDVSDEIDQSASSAELLQLELDLSARQQGAPLIHAQVDAAVVAAIVADWTGIPVGRMVQDDAAAVVDLHATLSRRVKGQNDALNTIVERVQVARARLTDPGKPVGVFLLVGPSGVGKTETALALAEAMYGGEQNLITINMSEFQESHTVSTLKGAPPGYVGYGEGGVLTEAVRRRPYSVILLDEVEKAHPDVHEIFYQVFDKGWMEDGEGRPIDFRNTIILLTSNTGSEVIAHLCDEAMPTPDVTTLSDALQPELRRVFPAAFIGRISIVPYMPLDNGTMESVALLQLDRVAERMQSQHGIDLHFSSNCVQHFILQCSAHETGARRLIGFIEQSLLPVLSRHWLDALQNKRTIARISVDIESERKGSGSQGKNEISCAIDYA